MGQSKFKNKMSIGQDTRKVLFEEMFDCEIILKKTTFNIEFDEQLAN